MILEQEIEKYLSGQTLCNCDRVSYRNIKNLILGFAESREKRIEELEKENNKLESRNDNLVKMYNEVVERQNSFQQSLYKNIEELEKENAELKKEVEKHKWNDIFLEESAFYDKKNSRRIHDLTGTNCRRICRQNKNSR